MAFHTRSESLFILSVPIPGHSPIFDRGGGVSGEGLQAIGAVSLGGGELASGTSAGALAIQAACVSLLDLSTVRGVILFGLFPSIASIALNLWLSRRGLRATAAS